MNGSFTLEQYQRSMESTGRRIVRGESLFATFPGLHAVCEHHEDFTGELPILNEKRTPLYLLNRGNGSYRLALCLVEGREDDEKHVRAQSRHFLDIVTRLLQASLKPPEKRDKKQLALLKSKRNGRRRKASPHRRSKGRIPQFR